MARGSVAETLSGHVVVCNVNEKVQAIVDELWTDPAGESIDVVLVVQDSQLWQDNPQWQPQTHGKGRIVEVVG